MKSISCGETWLQIRGSGIPQLINSVCLILVPQTFYRQLLQQALQIAWHKAILLSISCITIITIGSPDVIAGPDVLFLKYQPMFLHILLKTIFQYQSKKTKQGFP